MPSWHPHCRPAATRSVPAARSKWLSCEPPCRLGTARSAAPSRGLRRFLERAWPSALLQACRGSREMPGRLGGRFVPRHLNRPDITGLSSHEMAPRFGTPVPRLRGANVLTPMPPVTAWVSAARSSSGLASVGGQLARVGVQSCTHEGCDWPVPSLLLTIRPSPAEATRHLSMATPSLWNASSRSRFRSVNVGAWPETHRAARPSWGSRFRHFLLMGPA
jgi:hypothetical protein